MSKWMPPKPDFKFTRGYEPIAFNGDCEFIVKDVFDAWYDTHIVPMFENAVEMYACGESSEGPWSCYWETPPHTHKGLLINVRPMIEESAEDLLRDLADEVTPYCVHAGSNSALTAWQKAKAFLERKKDK